MVAVVALSGVLVLVDVVQAADQAPHQPVAAEAKLASAANKEEEPRKSVQPTSPIQVRGHADRSEVVVATNNKAPQYTIERIPSPDRVVIDFEGEQLVLAPLTTSVGNEFVNRVRIAQHPNKARVVVDLKPGAEIAHKASIEAGAFVLTLSKGQASPASVPVAKSAQAGEKVAAAAAANTKDVPAKTEAPKAVAAVNAASAPDKSNSNPPAKDSQPKPLAAANANPAQGAEKVAAISKEALKQGAPQQIASGPKGATNNQQAQTMLAANLPKEVAGVATSQKRPEVVPSQPERVGEDKAQSATVSVKPAGPEPKTQAALAAKASEKEAAQLAQPAVASEVKNVVQPAALKEGSDVKAKDQLAPQPAAISEPKAQPVVLETAPKSEKRNDQSAKMPSQQQDTASIESAKPNLVRGNETAGTIVQSVALEGADKNVASVIVGLQGSSEYNMQRTAPSEYVLTLRDAKPTESVLKQTLFTSRESAAIRSVRTTVEGNNTLVRIFTQPSSYLTTRKSGDKVFVEETQDLTQVARDIRAQMAPAAAKEDGKKEKANKPSKQAAQSDAALKQELAANSKKDKSDGDNKATAPAARDSAAGDKAAEDGAAAAGESEYAAMKMDSSSYTGRLISLDLQDADIDSALRIIAEVSNLNIVAGDGVAGKVTLKLVDVPWDQALEVILKSHGLDKVLEGNVLRVAPVDKLKAERESFKQARVAEEELEPLSVKYIRVSYAKASEIKALVETVLSERGSVAFDERSNQLVVKDVRKGLQNVTELIKKVDLRTPQILLETQIVEAGRNLSRELGSELGFQYIQSPSTGNGTGLNFPSAVSVGGSVDPGSAGSITGSAFPAATAATLGSAVTMLFDSADGTKSLALRLSQLEQEGQVRIISKPAVATTNNKPAEIKSVEKFRVKLPNGGLSIATGSGAQSSGAGDVATQTIEAGIILNVTPQASPDYYILLDIRAKSSSFGAKVVDGIPNEIERSASSSVLVSSGQTFALGGIYKIMERESVSGVPFFKDIPVLGTFFRNNNTENTDEELLFFITPRIVEGSFEDASMRIVS
jgi:type IV pilus assembly protein PilQ